MTSPLRLGQLLMREGLVSREDVDSALVAQRSGTKLPIGRLLVQLGGIDEATLAEVLALQFGLSLIDLEYETPDADALACLPREAALGLQALPLRHQDDRLLVVVADPPTRQFRHALLRATCEPVRFAVARADLLARALAHSYPAEAAAENGACASADPSPRVHGRARGDRIVTWLLDSANDLGATAVHLDAESGGFWVRYRGVDATEKNLRLPIRAGVTLATRVLRAAGLDPTDVSPQVGAFRAEGVGLAHQIRVVSARTPAGCAVVVRLDSVAA